MATMNTYTGNKIDPMNMTASDISIQDIAHALSLTCRGGGHVSYFFSVAQHSINCMNEAKARGWSERLQLACLLHDASEAYISDIIRPVKAHLSNYLEIESSIMNVILERFGLADLSEEENAMWKQIDDDMMNFELKNLMKGEEYRNTDNLSSVPAEAERPWREVEELRVHHRQTKRWKVDTYEQTDRTEDSDNKQQGADHEKQDTDRVYQR